MRRREFFGAVSAPLIVGALPGSRRQAPAPQSPAAPSTVAPPKKGRLKQGVTGGVFARSGCRSRTSAAKRRGSASRATT